MPSVASWIEEGIEIGFSQGMTAIILLQLSRIFGELDAKISNQISRLTIPQLEKLGTELLHFDGLEDLRDWLAQISQNNS